MPIRELLVTKTKNTNNFVVHKNPKIIESLKRTISTNDLPPISKVEDAKCECCGMCEECTPVYIRRVRDKFNGKLICGLCGEAVKEEMEKNGGKIDEALSNHMSACVSFNRFGRTHPILNQVEAMKVMLKKSNSTRANSLSPRVLDNAPKKLGGLTRTSSCIPSITKELSDSNW